MKSLLYNLFSKIPRKSNILGYRMFASNSDKLISLDVSDKTGIALLTLNRQPVNALNLEIFEEINSALTQLKDNRCKGLIITSSCNTVFSAGLDILEMYKFNPQRLKNFWINLQDCWLNLYSASFPTAAAINGHAPAGGCFLGISCEYRVMVPNFKIGLNETQVGIVVPKWLIATMKNVLPTRIAENALTLGTLFTTDEALKIGLIDEIANDKDDAIAKCEKFILNFSKISPVARSLTKLSFRNKNIQNFNDTREKEVEQIMCFFDQPKVQEGFGNYLELLKTKRK